MISTEAFCLLLLVVATEQADVNRIRRQCPCAQIIPDPCSCQVGVVPQCNCVQPVYQEPCSCGVQPQTRQCKSQCQQSCMSVCSGDVVTSCPLLCQNTCSESCAPPSSMEVRLVMPLALAVSSRCVPLCQRACSNSCSPGLRVTSCVPVCKQSCQKKCAQFALTSIKDCPAICKPSCSADCVSKTPATDSRKPDQRTQVTKVPASADVPQSDSSPNGDEAALPTITPDTSAMGDSVTGEAISQDIIQPIAEALHADAQIASISELSEAPQGAANPPGLFTPTAPAPSVPLCIEACMPNCDPKCIQEHGLPSSNGPTEQSMVTVNGGQQTPLAVKNGANGHQSELDIQNQGALASSQKATNGQQFGDEVLPNGDSMSLAEEPILQELSGAGPMPAPSSNKKTH